MPEQNPMDCSPSFLLSAPMMSTAAVSDQLEDWHGYSIACSVPSQLSCPTRAPHRLRLWGFALERAGALSLWLAPPPRLLDSHPTAIPLVIRTDGGSEPKQSGETLSPTCLYFLSKLQIRLLKHGALHIAVLVDWPLGPRALPFTYRGGLRVIR